MSAGRDPSSKRAFVANPPIRVAVIGAGIAGIAMTHALRDAGLEVELFEQSEEGRARFSFRDE